MSTAHKLQLVSVDDYLARELQLPVKHEYVGGVLYAMAGGRNLHNRIATDTLTALGVRLRGQQCQPYNSDTKIRIRMPTQTRFYYPDASVVCRSNPPDDSFQDEPVVVAEVLSERTRRIDEGEKKEAYLTIASLSVYLLIEQDAPLVTVFRRTDAGFVREVHEGLEAVISLGEIGIELPLAEVYASAKFVPEPNDDEK
jgi:Uma2 family endonuclease